jgi:ubiquinone biosynthesis protein
MKVLSYAVRLLWMGAVIWWGLSRYLFGRLVLLGCARGPERESKKLTLLGSTLRETLATLGATFVKLGQVLSTRPDLLPSELIDELRKLQDRMPPFSFAIVRRTLQEDLGERFAEFVELDEAPVAAASVAQVHRGRLRDGSEVAVKVLRPSVHAEGERAVAILLGAAKLLALHPEARLSDPVGHVAELSRGILAQTDLRNELQHYEHFRTNFKDVKGVEFPRTIAGLSSARVLTMDFIRGVKLDALPAGDHAWLARRLEDVILKMCFDDGFVHADLHPGNMLLREEDRTLVIFDVGLAKQISPHVVEEFTDFARCFAMGTAADFVAHFKRFHSHMADADWAGLEVDITRFLSGIRNKNTGELELGPVFNEMYALGRNYKVRPISDVVLVMVGVVTAEGIGKMLHPGGNIFEAVARALVPLLARRKAQGYNSLIPGAREAALEAQRPANDVARLPDLEASGSEG